MRSVGAYEAKSYLPRLLDEVAKGETMTITRHGVPVAMLVPPPGARRPDVGHVIQQWGACARVLPWAGCPSVS